MDFGIDAKFWAELQQLSLYKPSSPVPELLRTLHHPSSSQVSDIRNTVSEGQERLSKYDTKILQLQNILDEISDKRAVIDRYVKEHQSILSPIRRLPVELLAEIFCICTFSYERIDDYWSPMDLPWLLTQVCVCWRDVALATPKVWSIIDLSYQTPDIDAGSRAIDRYTTMVRTWLARSGDSPLTITIKDGMRVSDELEPYPIADMLLACSDRWRHLTLSFESTCQLEITELPLALLQSVDIWADADDYDTIYDFQTAHQLRCLHLYRFQSLNSYILHWNQLTEVHMTDLDLLDCLRIFERCPKLTCVKIDGGQDDPNLKPEDFPKNRTLLQSLHTLHLALSWDIFGPTLISHLTAPNLRDLSLRPRYHLPWDAVTALTSLDSLVQRSNCVLERLHLAAGGAWPNRPLEKLLTRVSSLKDLDITNYGGKFYFGPAVVISTQSPPLLPNLKVLKLRYKTRADLNEEILLEATESRWSENLEPDSRVVALQKLQINFENAQSLELATQTIQRLGRLKEGGMDISMWDENDGKWLPI